MVTPHTITTAANTLAHHYQQLAQAHRGRQPQHHTRHPQPTSRPPAPLWAINLDHELTSRLFEIAQEIRDTHTPHITLTHNGQNLCAYITRQANTIAQLDWAADIVEELDSQTAIIAKHLGQTPACDPIRRDTTTMCHILNSKHIPATPASLRKWKQRSQHTPHPITTINATHTTQALWLETEIINYLMWRSSQKQGNH